MNISHSNKLLLEVLFLIFLFFLAYCYLCYCTITEPAGSSIRYSIQLLKIHLLNKDALWMVLHEKSELNFGTESIKMKPHFKGGQANSTPSDMNFPYKMISHWE